jgi:hypothetical protein
MADFGRGIKAGAVGAAAFLILAVVFTAPSQIFWQLAGVISAAGLSISLEPAGFSAVAGSIARRVFQGVMFGAIFAALHEHMPGTTSLRKGLVFSGFLWMILLVELVYTTAPQWPTDGDQTVWVVSGGLAGVKVTVPSISMVSAGIISALAFGALVGFLWNKFRGTGLTAAGRSNGALLVAFTLGLYLWLSPAVGIIIYLINKGTIIMEPGPLWWSTMLGLVTAFLGTLGWVLALIAWLKARGGQSGFKWGLAGGVIMVGTGLMLVPGVMAIIGGVLSRHGPISEPSTLEMEQVG